MSTPVTDCRLPTADMPIVRSLLPDLPDPDAADFILVLEHACCASLFSLGPVACSTWPAINTLVNEAMDQGK